MYVYYNLAFEINGIITYEITAWYAIKMVYGCFDYILRG